MADLTFIVDHRDVRCRWAAALIIIAVTTLRLVYLYFYCPYDLAPDEAHYWDWSRHLDWSYYSKGPLIAWIIRAGCELFGDLALATDGTLMPAVRTFAVLFGGGLLAGLYVLTYQSYRNDRMALAITLVALTLPGVALGSMVMTIDAPFLFFWCWALIFGRWAMLDGKRWAWPIAGAFIALGILAKYTMALWLASAGLFLLFTPTHRRLLFESGFWVMVAVAGLSALPILYWNYQNDWVTFRHVAVQAGVVETKKSSGIRWFGPFKYVGEQAVVLFGLWFVFWFIAMIRYRPRPGIPVGMRFLWWMSAPTFIVFGLSSIRASGQLNWPVATYLSGGVLSALLLVEIWRSSRRRLRRVVNRAIVITVVLSTIVTLVAHDTRPVTRFVADRMPPESPDAGTPMRKFDPAARLKGARFLAQELDIIRQQVREAGGGDPVLAGLRWDRPGLLGFYCEGHPQAYSFGLVLGSDRHSQYDHWQNPVDHAQDFVGKTFIVVGIGDPRAPLTEAFESVGDLQEIVYREHDRAIARWSFVICRGYKGFDPSKRATNAAH